MQIKKATRAEIKAAREEQSFWNELGNAVGWKLYAHTGKVVADFRTEPHKLLEITAKERSDILNAIENAWVVGADSERVD